MEISENMARIDRETTGETKGEIVVYQPDEITRLEVKECLVDTRADCDFIWCKATCYYQAYSQHL